MQKLVLSSNDAKAAVYGDHSTIESILLEVGDEWRWGVWYRAVVKDSEGNLWGTDFQVQTGDNYYNSLEENSEVEFYPVVAKEVTVVTYEEVKD